MSLESASAFYPHAALVEEVDMSLYSYFSPLIESSGDKPFRVILWKKYIIQGFFETL